MAIPDRRDVLLGGGAVLASFLTPATASQAATDAPSQLQGIEVCYFIRKNGILNVSQALLAIVLSSQQVSTRGLLVVKETARGTYAKRDFQQTLNLVDELVTAQPDVARWHEMRAAVRVDNKQFQPALEDYERAIASTSGQSIRRIEELFTY